MRAIPGADTKGTPHRWVLRFTPLRHLVIIRPGILGVIALLSASAVIVLPLARAIASELSTADMDIAPQGFTQSTFSDAVWFGALLLFTMLLHELGHIAVNAAVGRRHHVLNLGWKFYVQASACPPRLQIAASASGPTVELLAGALMWAAAGAGPAALATPMGAAGVLACLNAFIQFLPIGPRHSDGRQLWRSAICPIRPQRFDT